MSFERKFAHPAPRRVWLAHLFSLPHWDTMTSEERTWERDEQERQLKAKEWPE
jgi:hypothetical protein